jgi:hypothetical protein
MPAPKFAKYESHSAIKPNRDGFISAKSSQEEEKKKSFVTKIKAVTEDQYLAGKKDMVYPKKISDYARTRDGSKILQKDLQNPSPMLITYMVKEIGFGLADMMIDVYGNYFCQKLFDHCASPQRLMLL